MGITIFVQPDTTPRFVMGSSELIADFDDFGGDDGYYWFLYPLFQKLGAFTGQNIDLYGAAIFGGDHFNALEVTIDAARQLTESQPAEWDVVVGFEVGPSRREVREPVNKTNMLSLLDKIQSAIAKARAKNQYVVFWGD